VLNIALSLYKIECAGEAFLFFNIKKVCVFMKKIKIKQNREGEFGMEFKNIVAKTNFPLQPYCRPNI